MPLNLSDSQKRRLAQLEHGEAFLWFLEVDTPTSPVRTYRFVRNPKPIARGTFSDGTPKVYDPFPFTIDRIESNAEGSLFTVGIGIANVSREVMAAIEHFDGLIDSEVRWFLANSAELGSSINYYSGSAEIQTVSAKDKTISVEVGHVSLQSRDFPSERAMRLVCGLKYGGRLCQYDTSRVGALPTCSKRFSGPNGCEEHGFDEEAAGLPNLHPQYFGGFLGIVRQIGS